jgi:cytochrome oxidase Cu insertion factor (SCO1/SenC/PrrC family)
MEKSDSSAMRRRAMLLALGLMVVAGVFFFSVNYWTGETSPTQDLPLLYETPEFVLTNCTREPVSRGDLLGHNWVVNFIFTRCQGPCPLMTQKMVSLQILLREEGLLIPPYSVKLVSITVDPAHDTPEVLTEYAQNWGADLESWYFLSGPENSTLELISTGFKIAASREGSGSAEHAEMPEIMHGSQFLLVDNNGWVRRIYPMNTPDLKNEILEAIRVLAARR